MGAGTFWKMISIYHQTFWMEMKCGRHDCIFSKN
jgi:hypothetical protein